MLLCEVVTNRVIYLLYFNNYNMMVQLLDKNIRCCII